MSEFNKPPIDFQQQLEKFEQNGLSIDDREAFMLAIKTAGYYRLKGYLLPYKERQQRITSSQLLDIYAFDRKLRLLFLDAIERIEITLKAIVSVHMSLTYGPFWFNDANVDEDITSLVTNHYGIKDINHKPIAHYYSKHTSPDYPPSWMIMEVIGMSDISKIISRLPIRDIKPLIQFFDISPRMVKSWVRSLTVTRNICAHHGRLWDRSYKISPEKTKEITSSAHSGSLAEQIMITDYLVAKVSPEMDFYQQTTNLINEYDNIVIQERIGFIKTT
jgi:abortive infection bacteriophage resistance protein